MILAVHPGGAGDAAATAEAGRRAVAEAMGQSLLESSVETMVERGAEAVKFSRAGDGRRETENHGQSAKSG